MMKFIAGSDLKKGDLVYLRNNKVYKAFRHSTAARTIGFVECNVSKNGKAEVCYSYFGDTAIK